MKYLFASDIHGTVSDMLRLVDIINKEEKPDKAIFLGDFCGGGDSAGMSEAFKKIKAPFSYARGNCDDERLFLYGINKSAAYVTETICGRKIFGCHGHINNRGNVPYCLGKGDIFIYGHLHTPFIEEEKGIIFVNDGSMARPRGGAEKTYVVIDDNGIYIKDAGHGGVLERRLFSDD